MNNYYTNKYNKIAVTYLHRKPVKGFSFSIESIFIHLRNQLTDKIDYSVVTCRFFNSGFLSIIFNCIHILFRKKKGIRHITGEVHFLNLLLNRKKTILTIHDCGMYYRKKGISRWLVKLIYLSWPIKKAQIITTVSFETKNQIIEITNKY